MKMNVSNWRKLVPLHLNGKSGLSDTAILGWPLGAREICRNKHLFVPNIQYNSLTSVEKDVCGAQSGDTCSTGCVAGMCVGPSLGIPAAQAVWQGCV